MQKAAAVGQSMGDEGHTDSAEPSRLRSPAPPADAEAAAAAAAASSASGGTCEQPRFKRHCLRLAVTFARLRVAHCLKQRLAKQPQADDAVACLKQDSASAAVATKLHKLSSRKCCVVTREKVKRRGSAPGPSQTDARPRRSGRRSLLLRRPQPWRHLPLQTMALVRLQQRHCDKQAKADST